MRLPKFMREEPFTVCWGIVLVTVVVRHGFDLPLWTLPLAIAAHVASGLADDIWQKTRTIP